jgi:mycofactocin system glycosyltransferase
MTEPAQIMNEQRGAAPVTAAPLPLGWRVELDRSVRRPRQDLLVGGSPTRLLRLSARGVEAFTELRDGPVQTSAGATLARRLTDAGLAHPQPGPTATADLVVVVPAHDRADLLDRCLRALADAYPVVVVDDASKDPAAIQAVADRHGARLIRRHMNGGPAAARNTGLTGTDAALIAFVDSDCAPTARALARLAAHLADPSVAAVAPRIVPDEPGPRCALDLGPHPARVAPGTRTAYVPTTTLIVRRSAIGAGFDPSLRYGEDVDLIWRLTAAGALVRYDPSVRVPHVEPTELAARLRRRFRYGTSAAPLTRRHPGVLVPLVLEPWTAAALLAAVTGHPKVAATLLAGAATDEVRRRRDTGLPASGAAPALAQRLGWTARTTGSYLAQTAGPLVLAGLVNRRTRVGTTALLLAEPLASWWTRRAHATDPVRWTATHLAEDVAYGAGVIAGCARARTVAPLLPRIRRVRAQRRTP